MRISDWSSAVCSSDRSGRAEHGRADYRPWRCLQCCSGGSGTPMRAATKAKNARGVRIQISMPEARSSSGDSSRSALWTSMSRKPLTVSRNTDGEGEDRKSVGEGKRVSVGVYRGGRRIIKQKKKLNKKD